MMIKPHGAQGRAQTNEENQGRTAEVREFKNHGDSGRASNKSLTIPEVALWERQRFHKLVDRRGKSECWPWKGSISSSGYGRFRIGRKLYLAHRVAFTIAKGPIPRGEGYHGTLVMHSCDNPPCCNPEHLSTGTHSQNMIDMIQKGRGPNNRPWAPGTHPKAKLTPKEVSEICASPLSSRAIAPWYGVSQTYVNELRKRMGCSRPMYVPASLKTTGFSGEGFRS